VTESSLQEKSENSKKVRWQTITVVLVLAAFVAGGIIFSEWGQFAGPGTRPDAIAVLPFENTSQDGYAANLADSLAESIGKNIAQNSTLQVVSREEISRYKGKTLDVNAIGKALKARLVVKGKILREGDNVTIKVELVEVEKSSQLWAQQYNSPISDITKLPEEIAREVLAAASPHK
jgi:TolB-like protein